LAGRRKKREKRGGLPIYFPFAGRKGKKGGGRRGRLPHPSFFKGKRKKRGALLYVSKKICGSEGKKMERGDDSLSRGGKKESHRYPYSLLQPEGEEKKGGEEFFTSLQKKRKRKTFTGQKGDLLSFKLKRGKKKISYPYYHRGGGGEEEKRHDIHSGRGKAWEERRLGREKSSSNI